MTVDTDQGKFSQTRKISLCEVTPKIGMFAPFLHILWIITLLEMHLILNLESGHEAESIIYDHMQHAKFFVRHSDACMAARSIQAGRFAVVPSPYSNHSVWVFEKGIRLTGDTDQLNLPAKHCISILI